MLLSFDGGDNFKFDEYEKVGKKRKKELRVSKTA